MKKILLFAILLFGIIGSFNQCYSQEPFFKQLQVSSTTTGLKINSICQDSQKIIWLGTTEGLFKYDGFVFQKVDFPKEFGNEVVSVVAASPKNRIYAGTQSGKLFLLENGKLTIMSTGKFQVNSAISGICYDKNSYIWISTLGDGLYRIKNNIWEHYSIKDGLGDNYIYSIVCDSSGKVWAGSDGGLAYSRLHNGKIEFINLNSKNGLPDNIILQLAIGPGNTIGIGMEEKGFCLYLPDDKSFLYPDAFKNWKYGPIKSLMMLENEFWIGTSRDGIIDYEFKGYKRIRRFSKDEGFEGLNLNCMINDNEGNVWIGAGSELYFSPGERIEFKRTLENLQIQNIRTILADKNNNLWFSNDSSLFYYNNSKPEGEKLSQPLKGSRFSDLGVISMYEDTYGYIWMGTFDHGVLRFQPSTGIGKLYSEADGLVNSSVLSIDGDGETVWFATLGGVSKCNIIDSTLSGATAFVNFSEENGLGNNFIYKVLIDVQRRVWFATDGKGITKYVDGKFTNYSVAEGLKSKVIYSLTEDFYGNIWLSSSADGIYRFDGKSFRNFSIAQGLSDINITSLATDKQGNILSVHKKGIDAIDPSNFQIISYGNEVGINNIDPDVNVVDTDNNGNVWVGTQKGIIKLSFEQKVGDQRPVLLLNKVLCYLQDVDTAAEKNFSHNRNHISFDYVAIWYSDPSKVSYQYKLEGYNNEWITTRDRFITFPNLRPGKYSFNVRTSINGNFANSDVVTYDFKISFPFWQQLWFLLISTVVVIMLFYFYLRYRDRKAKSMEILQKEKIESQYQILKNQVNPHFLFNSFNTLITVIEDDKETAIEYVNKLSDFFRNILSYRDHDLILIKEELELVETYIFLQQKRYGNNFTVVVKIPDDIKNEMLIPPLALQILIENSLKHNSASRETPLRVTVTVDNKSFLIVSNNINPKFVKEPSTSIGLQNLKNRYKLIAQADIVVINDQINFTVKLPLIKQ